MTPRSLDTLTLLEFAKKVVLELDQQCNELRRDKATQQFARKLSPELWVIQDWLENKCGELEIESDERMKKRVESLLRKFEAICSWKPADEIAVDPVQRRDSLQGDHPRESHWANENYPHLCRLLRQVLIPDGLHLYARSAPPDNQHGLIMTLGRFVKGNKNAKQQATATAPPDDSKDKYMEDYSPHIQHLYQAVSEHCVCQRKEGHRHPIVANVHLGWPLKAQKHSAGSSASSSRSSSGSSSGSSSESSGSSSSESSDVTSSDSDPPINFHVLFRDHPHGSISTHLSRWQDTWISVSKPTRVKWQDKSHKQSKAKPISDHKDGFCGLISGRERVRLPLVYSDGQLKYKSPRRYSRQFELDTPSIPLGAIVKLDSETFGLKKRFVLSYVLARAVWQNYESNWMNREWTKDAIHFMYESRGDQTGLFVDEPFLHTEYLLEADDTNSEARIHKFPKVLALGIMLIEINLRVAIEDFQTKESFGHDGKLTANADAVSAENLTKDKKRWTEIPKYLTGAVNFCMNPGKFAKKIKRKDIPGQRKYLYEHVVRPLRYLCESAYQNNLEVAAISFPVPSSPMEWKAEQPSSNPSTEVDDDDEALQVPPRLEDVRSQSVGDIRHVDRPALPPKAFTEQPNLSIALDGSMANDGSIPSSDEWFSMLNKLNSLLRAKASEKDGENPPVRIAVLDTGIRKEYRGLVQGYRDYVTQKDDAPTDTSASSHGTNVVQLILKTFNTAHIYVARIFEQERMDDDKTILKAKSLVAEAVRDATTKWKVDVIAMAFGFETEHDDIMKAIIEAKANDVLVFAAASNYGNVMGIAFPARLHQDVICVFCTNARVKTSQSINPQPSEMRRYNLAIFGENIHLGPVGPLTGTSFSTAIAAGLAARLIDFSRHKDCRDIFKHEAAHLKRVAGMESVLAKIAGGGSGDGYYCVAPWRLLDCAKTCEDRASKRAAICETIKVALMERN